MTFREKALQIAVKELGVHEDPAGSNSGPRVNQYLKSTGLGPGAPWCMAFVNWCYRQAGLDIEHRHEASVGFFADWGRRNGRIVEIPQRGDVVCYNFDSDNWPDHVGIVESVGSRRIVAIEGNTAVGDDANGGKVMRRSRSISRCVFVRIEGEVPPPKNNEKRIKALVTWVGQRRKEGWGWPRVKRSRNWAELKRRWKLRG